MQKAGLGPKKGAKGSAAQQASGQQAAASEQPKLFASAAGGFSRLNTGGSQNTSTAQDWSGSRGSSGGAGKALQGMRGSAASAALGGGEESAKSGGMSDFGSKMAGGAAAIKAEGGSSAPAASKPSDKSSGSSLGGSSGGDTGSSSDGGGASDKASDKAQDKTAAAASDNSSLVNGSSSSDDDAGDGGAAAANFFGSVVKSYGNGESVKDEDGKTAVTGQPNEALLKDGGMMTAKAELLASAKRSGAQVSSDPESDPENFSDLSAARKKQLKRRMMAFLRRVDINYGGKKYMDSKTCGEDPVTCNKYGLTEGYLEMGTYKETEIKVSYKYSDNKWRLFTIGFNAPESLRRAVKRQAAAE